MEDKVYFTSTKTLSFVVEGEPVPQGRPKFANGHAYDPERSREYKAKVKAVAEEAVYNRCWLMCHAEMPIRVRMAIYKPIAKSDPKWKQLLANRGVYVPIKKTGDIENIAKGIMDAMNGVVYHDDCQVYSLSVEMRYSLQPRVEVEVEGLFIDIDKLHDRSKAMIRQAREENKKKNEVH